MPEIDVSNTTSSRISTPSLEVLEALHDQVQLLGAPGGKPMTDSQLANAILVILNVLIEEQRRIVRVAEARSR